VRITSNYFCAGLVLRAGVVVAAAPILQYMLGWRGERVLIYARRRGWMVDADE
jgi:hypothetical protein